MLTLAFVAALHDEVSEFLRTRRFGKIPAAGTALAWQSVESGPPGLTREPRAETNAKVQQTVAIAVIATGWGAAAAGAGAAWVVKQLQPSAIVAVGYCGSLRPGLSAGTLTIGESVVKTDPDSGIDPASAIVCEPHLVGLAHSSAQESRITVATGKVATTPKIVSSSSRKGSLGALTGAVAVDMETWHIAREAKEGAIPFLAVRAVVDTVDDDLPGFVERMAPGPRPPAAIPALRHVLGRPRELGGIVRTGIEARRARRNLAEFMSVFAARWQHRSAETLLRS